MNPDPETPANGNGMETVFLPVRIRVIGLGGAGCNFAEHMTRAGLEGVEFFAANTDIQALRSNLVANKIQLGARLVRGLGAGGDSEKGRACAELDTPAFKEICEGADVVFVLAGLGGGTGTGAAPVVARIAKECGALVLAITTLPWDFEGPGRRRQALHGLREVQSQADAVISLPNQRLFGQLEDHLNLPDSFARINEVLTQGLRGVWQMLAMRGMVNIDFADLRAVLGGRHSETVVATEGAAGSNRALDAVHQLLASPYLEHGAALAQCDRLLLSIVGGADLQLGEVNRIMEHVQRQSPEAMVTMGAAIHPAFAGRVSVTILASKKPVETPAEIPAPPSEMLPPTEADTSFMKPIAVDKVSPSKMVPPPPAISQEKKQQMFAKQSPHRRSKIPGKKMEQALLPLDVVSKGRFDKSAPNIRDGEDLDYPTYVRRGTPLN
ncbi:MAG: cell division protein FtsZ [Verrucomicrobia bacterium]|nr:cell division protein FtsZ [Verrucomicrobiota bacterium]